MEEFSSGPFYFCAISSFLSLFLKTLICSACQILCNIGDMEHGANKKKPAGHPQLHSQTCRKGHVCRISAVCGCLITSLVYNKLTVCPEAIPEVPEGAAEPAGNTWILEKFLGHRHDTRFLWA